MTPMWGQSSFAQDNQLANSAGLAAHKIRAGDLLGVTVTADTDMTRSVRVSSEGTIALPHLPEPVQATDLFPAQMEEAIRKAIVDAGYLREPFVTVRITEYASYPVTVGGAVRNSATFQITAPI